MKVDPRIFYYSFSLFDLLEENSVPVEIIYKQSECSIGVREHLSDLEKRFTNIKLIKR